MKQVRKCKYCGKEFVARNGMQKYCCEECQTKAKEARKKRQLDFMNAVEPVIDLQCQEYLTFAKAAILMVRSGDGSLICYKTLKVYEVC